MVVVLREEEEEKEVFQRGGAFSFQGISVYC